ncbi:nuclear transport factor 2 family protein [Pedobacter agri]|uniref:Nuclear transport factor 2 family protein n=1 Tax=Pedobacter agri TaxID=454586 RepID=A0A9X3DCB9_9SPHI|nr:nuclear transport factor 2 family protein [Pedobacter agri]MCX3264667.1 nuclear transport factor 2 family protein [Pedobacter agri]
METDIIISEIDALHKKQDVALQAKDADHYFLIFDPSFQFTGSNSVTLNLRDYKADIQSLFRNSKSIETSHYRIKSAFENEVFTEKIARKSIIIKPNLLVFSKKQTIQTEEVYQWKNVGGEWKVLAVEVVLEEKY